MPDYSDLMTRFRKAYGTIDRAGLEEILHDDFEWHMNWFPADAPTSTGSVLHGIDEMITELEWRKEHWTDVKFAGLREQFAVDLVTQTFTISGTDRGTPFNVAAVDLYTLVDERITKKDTYWKHVAVTPR